MSFNRIFRSLIFYLLLFVITISFANWFQSQGQQRNVIGYSDFLTRVQAGQVESVVVIGDETVTGTLRNGTKFETIKPRFEDGFTQLMVDNGVKVEYRKQPGPPWWTQLLGTILPIALVAILFFFMMQQTQGSGSRVMQFGRSRARLHSDDKKRITFADVVGIDEVKEELEEIVDFLKHPKKYIELGARIPKGVLLFGPPGTGKTWVARAVAGEAGVPFFSISGSDFVEMFVGVGASRVRDLFEQAKKNSPCIVFIDEIDAVGRMRGAGYGGGHDEREQTLNQLLVEMDGFAANEGIIVVAATNRPDILDPALLRPGRFDRQISIDRPDLSGRKELFRHYTKGKPLEKDLDVETLARRTPGFTPADVANLMNEAALLAARRRKRKISMEEIEDSIDRVLAGGPEKKSRIISDKEKRILAYHEAAHALVGKLLMGDVEALHKVTIIPRGGALGYALWLPLEDRNLISKQDILNRVTMALAGRVAEEEIIGEISTGAADDLEKSTKLVRRMYMEFGMSAELGPLTFGAKQDHPFLGRDIARDRNYSEEVAAQIDREVRETVTACYEKARELLRVNRRQLDKIADTLIEKETIEGEELDRLLEDLQQAS